MDASSRTSGWVEKYEQKAYFVNLYVYLVVEKELPNMDKFSCLKCTVWKGGPAGKDLGMDMCCATCYFSLSEATLRILLAHLYNIQGIALRTDHDQQNLQRSDRNNSLEN